MLSRWHKSDNTDLTAENDRQLFWRGGDHC
jgi:hypothetical protein